MINQPLARQWITEMRDPSNKKTTGALKTNEGECCLGLYCRAVKKIEAIVESINKYTFMGQKDWLPGELARELNITTMGKLTPLGRHILQEKYTELLKNRDEEDYHYHTDLTDWNDEIFKKDTNFLNMADVIETLVEHEATKGEECFEPFK